MDIVDMNDFPDPVFMLLYTYQQTHLLNLGRCYDNSPAILEGSDTGIGKTWVGCALGRWKRRKLFIVCPKAVVENWFNTCAECGVEVLGIANYEAAKLGKYYSTRDAFLADSREICPYIARAGPNFVWNLPNDAMIIFDEAHNGRNPVTINSRLMTSARDAISMDGPRLLLMTATIADTIDYYRIPAYLLGIAQLEKHAYNAWIRVISAGGRDPAEAIHSIVYPRYGARCRISEIKANPLTQHLFGINDVRAEVHPVSPAIERDIVAAYNDIDEAIKALKLKQLRETCPLTIILRARQRIEMLKVPTLSMLAMEYMLNDKFVAIFTNFTETATTLFKILDEFVQEEFNSFIAIIAGGQSAADRSYNIKAFRERRARCLICNINAGGVGISLDGDDVIGLISPPPSSTALKQALGRLYRAGGKNATQRIIYCSGYVSTAGKNANDTTFGTVGRKVGVEELIAKKLNEKLRTIEWFNNGDQNDLITI